MYEFLPSYVFLNRALPLIPFPMFPFRQTRVDCFCNYISCRRNHCVSGNYRTNLRQVAATTINKNKFDFHISLRSSSNPSYSRSKIKESSQNALLAFKRKKYVLKLEAFIRVIYHIPLM